MYDIIKRIILFLLPILKTAALETAADLTHEAAYGRRPVRPIRRPMTGYTRYNRLGGRGYDPALQFPRQRAFDEHGKFARSGERFHDVLMVAFDLTGPNMALTQQWLIEQMPKTGDHDLEDGGNVNLDAWWVADDTAGTSDCDSAVFVKQGNQEAARKLLREHGLTSE